MEIYFLNSDATSNNGKSVHGAWISRNLAVASGGDLSRESLSKIERSDIVALYVNKIGLVAIGTPIDHETYDVKNPADMVNPLEKVEYHRRIDWLIDLRDDPITIVELQSIGTPPTPSTIRRVVKGKPQIAMRFARLLSEPAFENEHCKQLAHDLYEIGGIDPAKPIPQFHIGEKYDRKIDIHSLFGGSAQSGIAPSDVVDAIFLFTGESGSQYGYSDSDGFDERGGNVFLYTGEGQVGDMEFKRGNRAVLEHSSDGRALHLFRSLGKGKGQQYLGEFVYASHRFSQGPDRNGKQRQMIVFELVPVHSAALIEIADEPVDESSTTEPKTLEDARRLAIAAANGTETAIGQPALRTLYKRSKAVKDYVLMRAGGRCESCKEPAPFTRLNGTPYLEPHHTTRVSDGGADHPRHVGAICPTCHREIHYGENGAIKNAELQAFLQKIEAA